MSEKDLPSYFEQPVNVHAFNAYSDLVASVCIKYVACSNHFEFGRIQSEFET